MLWINIIGGVCCSWLKHFWRLIERRHTDMHKYGRSERSKTLTRLQFNDHSISQQLGSWASVTTGWSRKTSAHMHTGRWYSSCQIGFKGMKTVIGAKHKHAPVMTSTAARQHLLLLKNIVWVIERQAAPRWLALSILSWWRYVVWTKPKYLLLRQTQTHSCWVMHYHKDAHKERKKRLRYLIMVEERTTHGKKAERLLGQHLV